MLGRLLVFGAAMVVVLLQGCSRDGGASDGGDPLDADDSGDTGDRGETGDSGDAGDGGEGTDLGGAGDTSDTDPGDSGDTTDTGPVTTCTPGAGSTVCSDRWASACGGQPIGAWTLESACASDDLDVMGVCYLGDRTDNSTVSGSLVIDQTTLTRDVTLHISLDVYYPPACTGDGSVSCSTIAEGVSQRLNLGKLTCADDGNLGCDCTFIAEISDASTAGYLVDGNELVTDPGSSSERRWAYCVADGVLTARESGSPVAEEDIVQVYSCAD